jgi:hypothetical protein
MDRQAPTARVLLKRSKKQKRLAANKKSETFGRFGKCSASLFGSTISMRLAGSSDGAGLSQAFDEGGYRNRDEKLLFAPVQRAQIVGR